MRCCDCCYSIFEDIVGLANGYELVCTKGHIAYAGINNKSGWGERECSGFAEDHGYNKPNMAEWKLETQANKDKLVKDGLLYYLSRSIFWDGDNCINLVAEEAKCGNELAIKAMSAMEEILRSQNATIVKEVWE